MNSASSFHFASRGFEGFKFPGSLFCILRLLGASFLACGLFVSSLTESQLVAGTATFGVLLFLWVLTWNQAAANDRLVAIATQLSLFDRFYLFARGAIDSKDVVFFALFIGFFLFLTLLSLESRRWRGVR